MSNALDQALNQFRSNLSNTASDVGKNITQITSPVASFIKQATTTVTGNPSNPGTQTKTKSLNYQVNDLQEKQSPIIKNFVKFAQQGIQEWAIKNPQQTQTLLKIPKTVDTYKERVQYNKENPFFNKDNTPIQWAGRVVEDVKKRGAFEGLHDLSNPILMNPYVEPIAEPIVSEIRVANYKAGRPNVLVNNILGQTDKQMAPVVSDTKVPSAPTVSDQDFDNIVTQEMNKTSTNLVNTKSKPVDKKQVDTYIKKWKGINFKTPQEREMYINQFLADMFQQKSLPSNYYWSVYKKVVPNATPSEFISAIKNLYSSNG
jgi:hypothetical protein